MLSVVGVRSSELGTGMESEFEVGERVFEATY
jgi:hypothetical protein